MSGKYFIHVVLCSFFSVVAEAKECQENQCTQVIILDKGVKRTLLIPFVEQPGLKVRSSVSLESQGPLNAKDGIVVQFKSQTQVSIALFEAAYNLKFKKKLLDQYYVFENISIFSDIQIIEQIISNEVNVITVKPNWKLTNKPR